MSDDGQRARLRSKVLEPAEQRALDATIEGGADRTAWVWYDAAARVACCTVATRSRAAVVFATVPGGVR